MGSVTTVGTGLTGFSWSLPGMEASARELAVGGSLEGGSGPGDESWMQSLA